MADIVLAQIGMQTWLVSGESFIDRLLANMLPADVTIEFVACQSQSEVEAIWLANTADPDEYGAPWMIHPAIAARCRNAAAGFAVYPVNFGAWSPARDPKSEQEVAGAARDAVADGSKTVVLTFHIAPGAPAFAADIANLRCGVLEAELVAQGVAAERIARERDDAADAADRIDIKVRAPQPRA